MSVARLFSARAIVALLGLSGGAAGVVAQDGLPEGKGIVVLDKKGRPDVATLLMVHRLGLPTVGPAAGSGR